jgi:hypothetical protein
MTPERVAAVVQRWVRLYTRRLPEPVARRRAEEIAADLHDHVAEERAQGTSERRIALAIASRLVRGLAADVAWRARHRSYRPVLRVAAGVGAVLSVPLVAMLFTDQVRWTASDFASAGVLLAIIGAAFELAVKKRGSLKLATALGVLGLLAGIAGEADDAPGLVLLGLLLVAGGCAVGVRKLRTSR